MHPAKAVGQNEMLFGIDTRLPQVLEGGDLRIETLGQTLH